MSRKVLKDCRKDGKERPWREKKLANLTYAEYLKVLHFRKAHNVKNCGQVLRFAKTKDGLKLYQTWFCKSRLCPLCNWRRTLKNDYELSQIFGEALRQKPQARFLFLTLTQRNSDAENLKNDLRSLNRSIYRLFKYKAVNRDLIGYVRSTEITINRAQKTYHPHVHILLMVSSSYFKVGHYLSQKEWTKLWQRARKLDYNPVVNVEVIRPKNKLKNSIQSSISEVAKYQVKDAEYLTNDLKNDVLVVDVLEKALANSRQLSFGKLLKEIRHDMQLDQKEDALIDIKNDEVNSENILGTVMYKWNSKVKNYLEWN